MASLSHASEKEWRGIRIPNISTFFCCSMNCTGNYNYSSNSPAAPGRARCLKRSQLGQAIYTRTSAGKNEQNGKTKEVLDVDHIVSGISRQLFEETDYCTAYLLNPKSTSMHSFRTYKARCFLPLWSAAGSLFRVFHTCPPFLKPEFFTLRPIFFHNLRAAFYFAPHQTDDLL